ncbi:hypothetical protein C1Y18_08075 [Pseudomonas sp. MPR-R5A]|nr:hypothetical protein C1Y25_09915 [Pseudomonas sp. MPBC4-3]PMX28488.1 hypothetical protein C1Y23_04740 [Pseudomonas sp. GW460-12]PMX37336.1 hypothetical protein C1Y24_03020 [Pseudomonas sp. MPR-R2A4]PMX43730.1 hypothetical protein C1Y26_02295 [Pseudomonas sp. MPR-R2A7]PMX55692.1 hypothetical protein C1Y17_01540 [Pseudomonas sp. MPR-R2A6]PMX93050.1 hypothetical protein C1Y21_04975 [Pseudomonas sp. MPR-R2A3]PMY08955.1 hypothetical protein C1Y18_08075 [Pseudomonas sp. MPR-R5A]PMY16152.1 hypot
MRWRLPIAPSVGASLLAKNERAPRHIRNAALSLTIFASKLAPTLVRWFMSPPLREPHAPTASLQSCTQRLRPHWSLRLACSVRARGGGRF